MVCNEFGGEYDRTSYYGFYCRPFFIEGVRLLHEFQYLCFPHRRFDCTLGFPGEGPSFGFINITSLMKHATTLAHIDQYLGDLGNVSFVFCQETRVNLAKCALLKNVLAKQGWDVLLGPQPEVRRVNSGPQTVRQAFGGVACLYRSGSVHNISIIFPFLSSGTALLIIVSLYGVAPMRVVKGFMSSICTYPLGNTIALLEP